MYHYHLFEKLPHKRYLKGIVTLHEAIFGDGENMLKKLAELKQVVIQIVVLDEDVIAYKIGYPFDDQTFYSWVGGVNPKHRNKGLAQQLMNKQHIYLKKKGYKVVQTKTMNKWRSMLLLNIKNGFDIVSTSIDDNNRHKILLQKFLKE
ncbi:GNAT superfamily N-acetyltransferase [Chryseomicrobium aureum]|uniref:GNAT family N-acetyltransferase n=1 Tax=Chryseomicrobium aureum TaxID=1441723 RepID=UPI00195D9D85|nr:GNAT family N-acetyltransferase [Chryseomicrobium aureum]MBM7706334.1 GNAT superfamily N-acetyltransferase [Chryseomicrobium aureum]